MFEPAAGGARASHRPVESKSERRFIACGDDGLAVCLALKVARYGEVTTLHRKARAVVSPPPFAQNLTTLRPSPRPASQNWRWGSDNDQLLWWRPSGGACEREQPHWTDAIFLALDLLHPGLTCIYSGREN